MKVKIGAQEYDCVRAMKCTEKTTLFLEDGGTVELSGIRDWSRIILEGGTWETELPPDIPLSLRPSVTAKGRQANSYRRGADGLVVVSVAVTTETADPVADLPEGYRPTAAVRSGDISVHPDGTVWASGSMTGTICYFA